MRKSLADLIVAGFGDMSNLLSTAVSKYCPCTAERYYGDKDVHTPGEQRCLGVGEYRSRVPGAANAYRNAGFHCNNKGRLESN